MVAADPSPLRVVAGLFVLVVPFEKLFPRHRQPLRRAGLGTDLAYALAQPVLAAGGLVAGVAVGLLRLAWVPGLVLRPVVAVLGRGVGPADTPLLTPDDLGVLPRDRPLATVPVRARRPGPLDRPHAAHAALADSVSRVNARPRSGAPARSQIARPSPAASSRP